MRKARMSPVLILAVLINFILFAVKLYIGLRTNSLCIYTDSMNNLADTLSAGLGFLGLFFVAKNPTARFPYGFGRLESLTGFVMAAIMTAAGFSFAYRSLERFFAPVPVWFSTKYAVTIAATCVVKLGMGVLLRAFRRRGGDSPVIRTLELDSFMDFSVTLATLISFSLTNYVHFVLDSVLGLVISVAIAAAGIRLILSAAAALIGEARPATEEQIRAILREYGLESAGMRIHSYGRGAHYAEIALKGTAPGAPQREEPVCTIIKKRLEQELGVRSTVEWEAPYEEERERENHKQPTCR